MKLLKIALLITAALVMFSPKLLSHSPEQIELTFDNETKLLQVDAQHEVRNEDKHYVEKIEVFLNGELRIVQDFKKQESKKSQRATFLIFDAGKGDKIKVIAHCSIHGEKTNEITVREKDIEKK